MRGAGAALAVLLGLGGLCAPLGALVLDFNSIKSPADAQGARKGSPCMSDKDCNTRRFCLAPREEQPFCAACRGLRRRCQRSAMCCPGTLCVNDVCATMEDATPVLERIDDPDGLDATGTTEHPVKNKPKGKPNIKKSQGSKETHREFVQCDLCEMMQRCDKKEKAVLELLTVALHFAVLVISGLRSVNQSYRRDRSAPGEAIKILHKLQKSSSAVTVVLVCHVKVRAVGNTHG
ncbi:Dickkopf-related protein 4 [Heterocephalus glaber]|uniref:Dickkopf-related protein 4 n=1 Tax=Heterocephalus glaber TaxID=10181 RepID=G5BT42_HETGA|nr:Dickkopf-related protein 4 [Heterocephalus glaber]